MSSTDPLAALVVAERNELEALLMEFDGDWEPDSLDTLGPRIATHPNPRYRDLALGELVKIDLQRRWATGTGRLLEDYLQRYPGLGTAESVSAELILAEYEARHSVAPDLVLTAYQSRFPQQYPEVEQLAGRASRSTPPLASTPKRMEKEPAQASIDTSRVDQLRDTKAGGETVPEADLPVEFGRYRILKTLGAGAMGKVYLAHDSQLDRQVAIKTPSFTSSDTDDMVTRFYREARSAAKLQHRNICPIYDVGQIDGRHFISMAFIKGRCMSQFIKPDHLPPQRTSAILVQRLAIALGEAHKHNVIHRDLKPANIMIDLKKEPIVMDFGLARQMDVESRVTQSGMAVGTPAYMSPEQVRGELDAVGAAADIYALGVILYELLTGRLPFQGPIAKVVYGIVHEEPARPSSIHKGLDPQLESICAKMMAKDLADRYRSMEEVALALKAYVKSPRQAEPTATSPATEPANSSSASSTSALTETGALNAFFAAQPDMDSRGTIVEPSAKSVPASVAIRQKAAGQSGRNNRGRRLFVALGSAGAAALLLGVVIYFKGGKVELDADSDAVVNVDPEGRVTIHPGSEPPQAATAGPSNATVAQPTLPERTLEPADLSRFRPAEALLNEWQHNGADMDNRLFATLSPDGERVAFRSGEGPLTISETASKQLLKIPVEMEDATSIAFALDRQWMATGHDNKKIRLWDAVSFAPVGEPFESPIEQRVLWVHLSADGTKLIAMGNDHDKVRGVSTFCTWDVATRKRISQFQVDIDAQSVSDSIDASADGSRVAVISRRDGPMLWDTSTGKRLPVEFEINERLAGMMRITGMDLSADGSRLAYGTLWGGPSYAAILDTSTGKELWNSGKQKGRVYCVQFTRDGRWLASTAGRTKAHQLSLWNVATGTEVHRWIYPYDSENQHADMLSSLSFSEDGSRLLLCGLYIPIAVWNLTGQDIQPVATQSPSPLLMETAAPPADAISEPADTIPEPADASLEPVDAIPETVALRTNDDRAIAQRLIDLGGTLVLADTPGRVLRLPDGEIQVVGVTFGNRSQLTDVDVPLLTQLPALENLTFWEGQVTDAGFRHLSELQAIKSLMFYQGCALGDAGLAALQDLQQLESLALFHTNVTDDGLRVLAQMPALTQLTIGTSFKGRFGSAPVTDAGLVHLTGIKQLRELSVLGPTWTEAAAEHVGQLKNLQQLAFGSPTIADTGIEPLANLQQLRSLTLFTPQVTDQAVARLRERLPADCRMDDRRDKTKYE